MKPTLSNRNSALVLKEIRAVCDEYNVTPKTLACRFQYPDLIKRLEAGQFIREQTVERILILLELEKFKMNVNNSVTIRQAVEAAHKFLKDNEQK